MNCGTRAEALLDLVHSDVMGPFADRSFSGSRYLLIFVDDFSHMLFVVPIKHKSEVFDEFVKFKKRVENQCSRKIKVFRSDNGTEYVNDKFKTLCENEGIVHQTTSMYTPEQNGVAERLNRTIIERVRCMLIDSGVDKKFWAEAANTAAYILNRIPFASNVKSPQEMWTKKKPNLKFLKVFGCKAMVHVPREKRKKLDAKSVECIMVGYCDTSKAYRLFNPKTQKIVISRHVVFIETQSNNSIKNYISEIPDACESFNIVNSEEGNMHESSIVEMKPTVIACERVDDLIPVKEDVEVDSSDFESANEAEEFDVADEHALRRSKRIAAKQDGANFCVTDFVSNDPQTLAEAMGSEHADDWKAAVDAEMDSLHLNETWCLSELPPGKKAIRSRWVFKTKMNANGAVVRRKARLVIKGYSQRKGIDYEETFAPVVRYTSLRFLLALAAKHDLIVHQMDAVTAFLNAQLKDEIYMHQPDGFEDGSGRVCKLNKSLYGLKQSSRLWNEKFNDVLLKLGLTRSNVDQCVYYKVGNDAMLFVAVYVDDVLLFSSDEYSLNTLKTQLSTQFKMKDLGEVSTVLGMRVTRNRAEGSIKIDQSQYIVDMLERFGMFNSNPVTTPLDSNQRLSNEMCPAGEAEQQEMSKIPYMQAVGCLLFAAQITRPDISFAVNILSRFSANPGKAHWAAAKRVMRYLRGTINYGILFSREACDLTGFCDADWASDLDERRSTTGYVFKLQGGPISWCTRRQRTVALSSTEAEFMAMTSAIQEAMWLMRLQRELTPNAAEVMILHCDNKSAIQVALNNSYSPRTKHVDVKGKFIKHHLDSGKIKLAYVPTNEMLADILTKGVTKVIHNNLCKSLGLS